jgi:CheY-like chemotaxis protein
VDDLGRTVTVRDPQRVACLLGSFAQVWQLAGGQVIATADDAWDDLGLVLPDDTVNLGNTKRLNLELLLDNILAHPKVHTKNVKILSFSSFVKELIDGHQKYNGIEVTTDLSRVLNSIVDSTITSSVSDLITDKILQQKGSQSEGSIEMRFFSDTGVPDDTPQDDKEPAKIAIVDDDIVILNLLKGTFEAAGATCDTFLSGTEFLTGVNKYKYDLIILDILMPGISGFDTLRRLQVLPNIAPIIVYSQAVQKEMAVQALSLGAKSYLIKPQKPEVIIQKAKELLNGKL